LKGLKKEAADSQIKKEKFNTEYTENAQRFTEKKLSEL